MNVPGSKPGSSKKEYYKSKLKESLMATWDKFDEKEKSDKDKEQT
jgi:hypothetical protein